MKRFFIIILLLMFFSSIAAQSDYPIITLENVETLQRIAGFGVGEIYDVAWSPDGSTIAAASVTGVWLYDVHNLNQLPHELMIPQVGTSFYFGREANIFYSEDGTRFYVTSRNDIWIWQVSRMDDVPQVIELTNSIRAVSADGLRAVSIRGREANMISIWSLAEPDTPIGILEGHTDTILLTVMNSDGSRLVTGGRDGTLRFWDLTSMELYHVIEVYEPSPDYENYFYY